MFPNVLTKKLILVDLVNTLIPTLSDRTAYLTGI